MCTVHEISNTVISAGGKQTPSDFLLFLSLFQRAILLRLRLLLLDQVGLLLLQQGVLKKIVIRHGLIEKVFHQTEIAIFTKKRLSAAAPASYILKNKNKLISVIFIWEMHMSALHLALCHCPERCHQLLSGHHHSALGHRGGAEGRGTEIGKIIKLLSQKKQ